MKHVKKLLIFTILSLTSSAFCMESLEDTINTLKDEFEEFKKKIDDLTDKVEALEKQKEEGTAEAEEGTKFKECDEETGICKNISKEEFAKKKLLALQNKHVTKCRGGRCWRGGRHHGSKGRHHGRKGHGRWRHR